MLKNVMSMVGFSIFLLNYATNLCSLLVPATPIVSWLCTVNLTLEWQKSTDAFFPDFEYTIVDLECYSGDAKIEEVL